MFSLIQHIVVTLLSRSKTVVEFFPIAAICRILPNKSNPEHVLYPLPWQIKSTLIILVFLPVRARFAAICRTLHWALIRHILSKKSGKNPEMRQIEANRGRHS